MNSGDHHSEKLLGRNLKKEGLRTKRRDEAKQGKEGRKECKEGKEGRTEDQKEGVSFKMDQRNKDNCFE